MYKLLEKVEKELENIGEKGITNSNLDTAYKLIDIYKDIKESKYYDKETQGSFDARARDSRGRFMGDYDGGRGGEWEATGRYNTSYPMLDERSERYFSRMRDGMERYNAGKDNYRGGDSQDRMLDGIEMTMSAICMFVESLMDFAETSSEKEIIRKHMDKMKKL